MMGYLRFRTAGEFPPRRLPLSVLLLLTSCMAAGQATGDLATLYGVIRDTNGRPVPNASVHLELRGSPDVALATNGDGAYRCAELRSGAYTLRAEKAGNGSASFGPVDISSREVKRVELVLRPQDTDNRPAIGEFFDEPQFTVAGITDTMNHGGHG